MATTNADFKYMILSDALYQDDISVSLFNSLTFTKEMLKKNFYIGVYGYEAADITLSVMVKRVHQNNNTHDNATNPEKNETEHQTVLKLKQGLSQQYSLKSTNKWMIFTFTTVQSK